MSFREMLEQVKAGRADPECEAAVKAEIEKHEVIADYLAERFDEQFSDQEPPPSPETGRIARRVRFRLLGSACLAVLAVFLIASAAVLFCDLSYYNPNKGIEAGMAEMGSSCSIWRLSPSCTPPGILPATPRRSTAARAATTCGFGRTICFGDGS